MLTGPIPFHEFGVHPVFRRNGCTIVRKTARAEGLHLVRENSLCPETRHPEPTGLVQVYDNDYLNRSVTFKLVGLAEESKRLGEVHYHTYGTWADVFSNKTGMCDG